VFDVAKQLMLADVDSREEILRTQVPLPNSDPDSNARQVVDLGADTLICGAISRPLESFLVSAGVEVIPQTCGAVEEVLHAFVAGELHEDVFVTPGCQRRRRYQNERYLRASPQE
jgi:predicted Fe-Mo cluster-binding NifX family protein